MTDLNSSVRTQMHQTGATGLAPSLFEPRAKCSWAKKHLPDAGEPREDSVAAKKESAAHRSGKKAGSQILRLHEGNGEKCEPAIGIEYQAGSKGWRIAGGNA
jgi:hypothetical protein